MRLKENVNQPTLKPSSYGNNLGGNLRKTVYLHILLMGISKNLAFDHLNPSPFSKREGLQGVFRDALIFKLAAFNL
jgi:hypothetical protein